MNLESQQKINGLYLELIDTDKTIQTIKTEQDAAIKTIPTSTCENAIEMSIKAITYQVVLRDLERMKTLLLEEIEEELVENHETLP